MDTIAAISTAMGTGGIGIIRISGSSALSILKKIFKTNKDIHKLKTHTITYGHICYDGNILDEVLVAVMLAPKTYTCEDVVEINCHGGLKSMNLILEAVILSGARLAEPGEFTKRAFLNGRIDLAQAESVIDIINSKTNIAHKMAVDMLSGKLSEIIREIRENIISMIATIEASIDYPEHDMEAININNIKQSTANIVKNIENVLKSADKGMILKQGIETVIIGRPNVGKSSLLNLMLEEDRAIVTDIAGTTRDILQEHISIEGIPLKIVDTAGIRNTDNEIEMMGILKTRTYAKDADLILMLIDASVELSQEDIEILEFIQDKNKIIVINKFDLENKINMEKLRDYVSFDNVVHISAKKNIGIEELYSKIKSLYFIENTDINEEILTANLRHRESLNNALNSLKTVLETINNGFPEDFISIDLQNAYKHLGNIIGEEISEDIIDVIFSKFCLGK